MWLCDNNYNKLYIKVIYITNLILLFSFIQKFEKKTFYANSYKFIFLPKKSLYSTTKPISEYSGFSSIHA